MKYLKYLIIFLIIIHIAGCTSTKYVEVPVDKVKIEYRDKLVIDTLIQSDSIIIKDKGDTIFIEKYKYLYKIKELRDTVNVTDTITKVNTVTVEKKVNEIKQWQMILMILGGGFIFLLGYNIYKLIKKWV